MKGGYIIVIKTSIFPASNVGNATLLDNRGTFHAFDANYEAAISRKALNARCKFIEECFQQS